MKKPAKPKVFWTDAEKEAITEEAVKLREERPDLASLPLLRSAMQVLPANRRRSVLAISQAAWFEPSLKAEIEKRRSSSVIPIAETMVLHRTRVDEFCDHAESQNEECISLLHQVVMMLAILERDVRALATAALGETQGSKKPGKQTGRRQTCRL